MIEAVNSVLANSNLLRGSVEQVAVQRSFASNPERVQEAPSVPQAPYISPYIYVDTNYNKAVLQVRDSDTGDVLTQFPSRSALRARQQAAEVSAEPVARSTNTVEASDVRASVAESSSDVATQGAVQFTGVAEAQVAAAALSSSAQVADVQTTTSVTA